MNYKNISGKTPDSEYLIDYVKQSRKYLEQAEKYWVDIDEHQLNNLERNKKGPLIYKAKLEKIYGINKYEPYDQKIIMYLNYLHSNNDCSLNNFKSIMDIYVTKHFIDNGHYVYREIITGKCIPIINTREEHEYNEGKEYFITDWKRNFGPGIIEIDYLYKGSHLGCENYITAINDNYYEVACFEIYLKRNKEFMKNQLVMARQKALFDLENLLNANPKKQSQEKLLNLIGNKQIK